MSTVYNYLNPGVEGENITYWLSQSNLTVPADRMRMRKRKNLDP